MTEERLKIAVFIDFDNIAIGVKQSLSRNFDIGNVLEAIKERGEVVTKVAYGDWKRAEEFSRTMTQHAVQMVQRNPTPGGDKNGADINLALDALEMAFTRDHINAFVIVGGDSDFIALVEKLKQYDKKVFVVGGRAFTSAILQKNCHEFIAYENLVGIQSGSRKSTGRMQSSSPSQLKTALPQVRRALKILIDREVSPQLGLLKSTLLQLDPTFSERNFGTTTFRDFIQKLADAGFVKLKQVDRSLLVELKEPDGTRPFPASEEATPPATADAEEAATAARDAGPAPAQLAEAVRAVQEAIQNSTSRPHWPMYLRTFKQFLRSANPPLDERRLGISNLYDLVRQAQRDGVLRVERNRQGILRIFPGDRLAQSAQEEPPDQSLSQSTSIQEQMEVPLEELPTEAGGRGTEVTEQKVAGESEEDQTLQAAAESEAPIPEPKRRRRSAAASTKRVKPAKKPSTRSRKKSAEPKHEAKTSLQE